MNNTAPSPWSEQAEQDRRAAERPTENDPVMFDIEDAIQSVAFSQVPGESLRGIIQGYFYKDGRKINLVSLTPDSARKAGWPAGEYMKVPQEVIDLGVAEQRTVSEMSPEQHEALVQEVSEPLGEEAIELSGIEEPSQESKYDPVAAVQRLSGEANAMQVEIAAEKQKNPKLEKLFAPSVRPEVPKVEGENSYDYLFIKDEEELSRFRAAQAERDRINQPIIEAQKTYDRLTNEDTRHYSEQRLADVLRRDPELRTMLAEKGFQEASLAAVDALREDAELRYSVGEYLLKKLDKAIDADYIAGGRSFGDRIIANGEKRTDYLPLPVRTTSREYVAYLALAKISGMFNYKVDSADILKDQDEQGKIIYNQHRHAAGMIL